MVRTTLGGLVAALLLAIPVSAQEPVAWGSDREVVFHTFSLVALDPNTGEVGTIVTTRNPCVGNGVPWVRAGVGAVATQGGTRSSTVKTCSTCLEKGVTPRQAMDQVVAADGGRENRQVGVIDIKGAYGPVDG